MSQCAISQIFKPSKTELILSFVSGSTILVFEDFKNITNTCRPEVSNLRGMKYFKFSDTIKGFSKLQPNWDSYNADVISQNAVDTAIETLNHLYSKGLLSNGIKVSVFPMRDGGIQFEFDGEYICAELEINQSSELTFILFDDEGSIVDERQLFELSVLSTLLEDAQYA